MVAFLARGLAVLALVLVEAVFLGAAAFLVAGLVAVFLVVVFLVAVFLAPSVCDLLALLLIVIANRANGP